MNSLSRRYTLYETSSAFSVCSFLLYKVSMLLMSGVVGAHIMIRVYNQKVGSLLDEYFDKLGLWFSDPTQPLRETLERNTPWFIMVPLFISILLYLVFSELDHLDCRRVILYEETYFRTRKEIFYYRDIISLTEAGKSIELVYQAKFDKKAALRTIRIPNSPEIYAFLQGVVTVKAT